MNTILGQILQRGFISLSLPSDSVAKPETSNFSCNLFGVRFISSLAHTLRRLMWGVSSCIPNFRQALNVAFFLLRCSAKTAHQGPANFPEEKPPSMLFPSLNHIWFLPFVIPHQLVNLFKRLCTFSAIF